MKLDVRHAFACTPEEYWKLYWSDEFDEVLNASSDVQRDLVRESHDGDTHTRVVRFTPARELPGPAAAIIGSKKLIYEQENRFVASTSSLHWEVVPTFLPGKLTAKGTVVVTATPQGCEQRVQGDISVAVRFIGGKIESAIVDEVTRSYEKMAASTREMLAKGNS